MLVFIDDSGDAGFKLGQGSSRYFVIAAVIFPDENSANKTINTIQRFKKRSGLPKQVELKFHKTDIKRRKEFLHTVNACFFSVHAIVVDKMMLGKNEQLEKKTGFYRKTLFKTIQNISLELVHAKIYIDGSASKVFRQNFLVKVRQEIRMRTHSIKSCKFIDSKSHVLIQLADMIAGSIRCAHEKTKTNHLEYRRIVQKHIINEITFLE